MPTDNIEQYIFQGVALHQQGNRPAARNLYQKILEQDPNNFNALHMLGVIYLEEGKLNDSGTYLTKAITINPNSSNALANLGLLKHAQGEINEAISYFNKAIQIDPLNTEALSNKALLQIEGHNYEEAIALLQQALNINPNSAFLNNNLGYAYLEINDLEHAIKFFNTALSIQPNYPIALYNRGNAFSASSRHELAILDFDSAIKLAPRNAEVHFNRANSLRELGHFAAADKSYLRALDIEPGLPYLIGTFIHNRMHLCDWSTLEKDMNEVISGVKNGTKTISPFALLSLIDSNILHNAASKIWYHDKCRNISSDAFYVSPKIDDSKKRIGYFSADFHNHATSQLIAPLFELHNRDIFEVHAFSFGPVKDDLLRKRINNGVDYFHEVHSLDDTQIVQKGRACGLDIAIDLKGYTQHSRPRIFAERLAPIQINYLGYPGTLSMMNMDYIIIDEVINNYNKVELELGNNSEKKLVLKHCYQINDRAELNCLASKEDCGLPGRGFIFCCFNSPHKILPEVFQSWMRILKNTPESYLWILTNNDLQKKNLRREAASASIDPKRLIFAYSLAHSEHLKRLALADVFLDTFPYTAHTSASDALRAGLPIVTLPGLTFASRVCASLLAYANCRELITNSRTEYENLSVELAKSPILLKSIKEKLNPVRLNASIFNPLLFTRALESKYLEILEPNKA